MQRPREEGARVQVLSSREQTEMRIVVLAVVPRDTRISIEDLVCADIESDIDELRVGEVHKEW